MPSRLRIATLRVLVAVVAYPLAGAAQAPQSLMGSWKLNIAKSKYTQGPAAPKSSATRVEAVPGSGAKFTVDGVDAAGKATHNEIVTMFDGKDAEYKGAAAPKEKATQ